MEMEEPEQQRERGPHARRRDSPFEAVAHALGRPCLQPYVHPRLGHSPALEPLLCLSMPWSGLPSSARSYSHFKPNKGWNSTQCIFPYFISC